MSSEAPPEAASSSKLQFRLLLFACSILFTFLILGIVQTLRQPPPKPEVSETPPPDLSLRPYGVVSRFLEEIHQARYGQAYQFLGAQVKPRLSRGEFESLLRGYREKQAGLEMMVQSERVLDKTGWVEVIPRAGANKSGWKFTLTEQSGKWKITQLQGQPFTSPD